MVGLWEKKQLYGDGILMQKPNCWLLSNICNESVSTKAEPDEIWKIYKFCSAVFTYSLSLTHKQPPHESIKHLRWNEIARNAWQNGNFLQTKLNKNSTYEKWMRMYWKRRRSFIQQIIRTVQHEGTHIAPRILSV